MEWNYLSIPKLQRYNRWSLWMDKWFHPTLYQACNYLSMLGLKLNHVSKRGHTSWTRQLIFLPDFKDCLGISQVTLLRIMGRYYLRCTWSLDNFRINHSLYWALIHQSVRRLSGKSHKVSKPWDWMLWSSYRFKISKHTSKKTTYIYISVEWANYSPAVAGNILRPNCHLFVIQQIEAYRKLMSSHIYIYTYILYLHKMHCAAVC